MSFGKLSRNIGVELRLPVKDRSSDGKDFVQLCRGELDRLIEQSPLINKSIIHAFEIEFPEPGRANFDDDGNFIIPDEDINCFRSLFCKAMRTIKRNPVIFTRPEFITIRSVTPFVDKFEEDSKKIAEAANHFVSPLTLTTTRERKQELDTVRNNNIVTKFIKDIETGSTPIVDKIMNEIVENATERKHSVANIVKEFDNSSNVPDKSK